MRRAHNEDGAVLLTTLLVMSIMAAVAIAVMDDIRFAVKRATHVQSYAQAEWYMQGAEMFAQTYLEGQFSKADAAQLNAVLLKPAPIIFDIDDGQIALSVRDGSHCLSLGALTQTQGRRVFRRLLGQLGWSATEAAHLTAVAVDWQDSDSQVLPGGAEDYTYLGQTPAYRTSNTEFGSVTELRALKGIDEKAYQVLRPFLCARSSEYPGSVNVNTLTPDQAPLLAALLGEENSYAIAMRLILDRPAGGYADMEALMASPSLLDYSLKEAVVEYLIFEPAFVWIEAEITYREAFRRAAFEFRLDSGRVSATYRAFGDDASRPLFERHPA